MKKELREVAEKLGYKYLVTSAKAEERITRELDNQIQYALLLGDIAKVISRRQDRQMWRDAQKLITHRRYGI